MKSLSISIIQIFLLTILAPPMKGYAASGGLQTAEFKVEGVCNMCKERIENGALIKGVKKAEWDKDTGMITVIYNPEKVTQMDIHKVIAEVGHSTDKVKAEKSVYDKLPVCCQYVDDVHKH